MALGSEGSPPNPWPGYVMRLASDPVSWAKQPNHTNEKASVSNIFSVLHPLWRLGTATLHDRAGDVEEHTRGNKKLVEAPQNFGHVHSGTFFFNDEANDFLTTDRSRGCYFLATAVRNDVMEKRYGNRNNYLQFSSALRELTFFITAKRQICASFPLWQFSFRDFRFSSFVLALC